MHLDRFAKIGVPGALEQPLFNVHVDDPAEGLRAFVTIHNLGPAGATGGVRCLPDVTLQEVQLLARSMAYKNAFFRKPLGGAKAGIVVGSDVPQERRIELAHLLGRRLAGLLRLGVYHPWTDMNFGAREIQSLYRGAGLEQQHITGGSARRAGLSTVAAIRCALQVLGKPPGESTIVIEGLGAVGTVIAERIAALGGKVVAVSNVFGAIHNPGGLPVADLLERRSARGDAFIGESGDWRCVSKESLFSIEADVLVPCARAGVIDDDVAQSLRVASVVPAANAPWTTEAEETLNERGILLLPDFVVNAGGILGALADSADEEDEFFNTAYLQMLLRLARRGKEVGVSPVRVARAFAERNAAQIGDGFGAPQSLKSRVLDRIGRMNAVPYLKHRRQLQARRHLEEVLSEDFAGCVPQ